MLIDTHAHLSNFTSPFCLDFPVVSVAVDAASSCTTIDLSRNNPLLIPAFGLHPWFVTSSYSQELVTIFHLFEQYNVCIMGEIGLDFSPQHRANKPLQLEAFEQQLSYAYLNNLSVSLHVYKAYDAMLSLLDSFPVQGVVHGFSGSLEVAYQFIERGLRLGVNSRLLCCESHRYRDKFSKLPIESLVLETDAPNLVYSNKDCEDLSVMWLIAQELALLKQMPLDEVVSICFNNAIKSLKIDDDFRSPVRA